jgi:hypothetical protein
VSFVRSWVSFVLTLVAPASIHESSLFVNVATLVAAQVGPRLLLLRLLPGVPLLLVPLLPPVCVGHRIAPILLVSHVASVLLVASHVAAILLAWLLLHKPWLCPKAQGGVYGLVKPCTLLAPRSWSKPWLLCG